MSHKIEVFVIRQGCDGDDLGVFMPNSQVIQGTGELCTRG